jgi:hypothetical protein
MRPQQFLPTFGHHLVLWCHPEMIELRCVKPDYADRVDAAVIAPDFPERTEIQGSVTQDPVRCL